MYLQLFILLFFVLIFVGAVWYLATRVEVFIDEPLEPFDIREHRRKLEVLTPADECDLREKP